jgi:hypothetical protein
MALQLAVGGDPGALPRRRATAGAAASLVYRSLRPGDEPPMPDAARRAAFARAFPDGLLFTLPKTGHALAREYKWLGSHRYGLVHLGGQDAQDLRERAEHASVLLGWPAPYTADEVAQTSATTAASVERPDQPPMAAAAAGRSGAAGQAVTLR